MFCSEKARVAAAEKGVRKLTQMGILSNLPDDPSAARLVACLAGVAYNKIQARRANYFFTDCGIKNAGELLPKLVKLGVAVVFKEHGAEYYCLEERLVKRLIELGTENLSKEELMELLPCPS